MQGNYVEIKLGLPLWTGIFFFSLFLGGRKNIMIGNITKKTMILSPPTPQQSTWWSLLFWWKKRVVAVVKLSHNLQPESHLHPQFSRAAPEAGALLYIPLPALGQLRIPKETCRVAEIKQNYSIWWMWALSDFSLFSAQRTDLEMPSLLACAQKTQTPLWGCLVPLAPPQWGAGAAKRPHKHQGSPPWSGCWHQPMPHGKEGVHQRV